MSYEEKIKQVFEVEAINEELQPEEIERRVLKILEDHKQKLEELHKRIKEKGYFELKNTMVDKESGYQISKPQQEFNSFLVWLNEKFAELGLDTEKEK